VPRPCPHAASATPDEKCMVCLRWSEYPEFYSLWEGVERPEVPADVLESRRSRPTAWRDPHLVRDLAAKYGTLSPEGEIRGDHELPGLGQRVVNFGLALAKHVAKGFRHATEEDIAARREACNACERKTPEDHCAACGCRLSSKIAWNEEECPLGRWPT